MFSGQRKRKQQEDDDVICIEEEAEQYVNQNSDEDIDGNQDEIPSRKESIFKGKPLWDEVQILGDAKTGKLWLCPHCKREFKSSYTRIHQHFFGPGPNKKSDITRCQALLKQPKGPQLLQEIIDRVKKAEKSGVHSQLKHSTLLPLQQVKQKNPIMESFKKVERDFVDSAIVRWLCACGVPFNILRSPFFHEMISAVNKAPEGYKAPSFEKARTSLLDEEKRKVENEIAIIKDTWHMHGVSIISDGWTNVKNQPLINVLAANKDGAMFLYAVECSGVEKTGSYIKSLLIDAIEEVGPSNIVQIITDNAANCKLACKEVEKVYSHIFWSPCACHTINLIFKDLSKHWPSYEEFYTMCKTIVTYIINHTHALAIFRSHSRLELLKVAKTRFASYYVMMKRLLDVRQALKSTVVLDDWKEWAKHGDEKIQEIAENIKRWVTDDDDTFWTNVRQMVKITKPIFKMIKFCDQDGPLMGEVYEGMDNMLGEIKDSLNGCANFKEIYDMMENIVIKRWKMMHSPLHCLGFALTPRFYDSSYLTKLAPGGEKRKPPNQDKEVITGVMEAFERLTNVSIFNLNFYRYFIYYVPNTFYISQLFFSIGH